MKYFLIISFLAIAGATIFGFNIKPEDPARGDFWIGISMVSLFFVWMPLFIYHRWKDRSMKDYMLTKENIDKMRKESKEKNL